MKFIVLGAFILWMNWLFFNAVGSFSLTDRLHNIMPSKYIMNTLICSSASAIIAYFLKPAFMKNISIISGFNPVNIVGGLLSGLAAATGSCNNIEAYSALVLGILSGFWYILSCRILHRFKVDDPVEAS